MVTLQLVPCIADAVSNTPIIAASGIADGRGIAATLALGADKAWFGIRYLTTEKDESKR
ncbi:hypothetical protein DMJ13_22845 [halophilic archaeon]|nr:hypothetical protein DMJ13_22845 [halophilic archaeon]